MTGAVMNVKRLAAVDMWGTRGTMRRRRIILAEFITGVIAATAVGAWIAVAASSSEYFLRIYHRKESSQVEKSTR
jgi:hypothetical protein